jgi:hypothetical protein
VFHHLENATEDLAERRAAAATAEETRIQQECQAHSKKVKMLEKENQKLKEQPVICEEG